MTTDFPGKALVILLLPVTLALLLFYIWQSDGGYFWMTFIAVGLVMFFIAWFNPRERKGIDPRPHISKDRLGK